jgi:hypothetical protein
VNEKEKKRKNSDKKTPQKYSEFDGKYIKKTSFCQCKELKRK